MTDEMKLRKRAAYRTVLNLPLDDDHSVQFYHNLGD